MLQKSKGYGIINSRSIFMKNLSIGNQENVSAISLGCMRIDSLSLKQVDELMGCALDNGINHFDHADIYGGGKCEELFGDYLNRHAGVRDKIFIQTKCAIKMGQYDFSKTHIINAVESSLKRLNVDYVDFLLLHRPDTLMEPEEVKEAFDKLQLEGKVKNFGVSNHNAFQIELLKTAVRQPLVANQLQFSLTEAGMITSGLNVNMKNFDSQMHDGGILEYSRIKKMTIQAWSPFQFGFFKGNYIDHPDFPELNQKLQEMADKYGITKTGVVAAWILRHPANMQLIAGTTNPDHLTKICSGADVVLSREDWYAIYLSAGHCLP